MTASAVATTAAARGMIDAVPPPSTPLVGRDHERDRLLGALVDPATTGVLVTGDAGVGKTRLLAEATADAEVRGARVLTGHCVLVGSETLPYLPVVEALGRLERAEPDAVAALVADHPPLAGLLPGLTGGGRLEAGELFEAVLAALLDLARATPVLVVVEDVHWADASTRDLLGFLLTRLADSDCRLLLTVRTDDVGRRHPLRPVLAEWGRLPGVVRIALTPLTDDAMGTLVANFHRRWRTLDAGEIAAIVDKAGGNPFFAEQLTASTGHVMSTDLADLLLVAVEQLSPDALRVVRTAAVAGRPLGHDLLAEVAGSGDVDAGLREAVDAYVLVQAGDDYEFRHALLAEAVYDDLLPGERVRLHAAFSAHLAAGGDPADDADLARHASAAHDLPTAYAASVRAAAAALRVGAPAEALALYESALGLSGRVGDVDVVDLTLSTAEAAALAGHPFRAVALAEDLLGRPDLTAEQRAELHLAAARNRLAVDTPEDPSVHTAAALDLVPADPPTELRARVLGLHAHASAAAGRHRDAIRWATEALDVARTMRLSGVAADAATTLARASGRVGEPDAGLTALREALTEREAAGDVAGQLRCWHGIAWFLHERADTEGAADAYRRGRELAVRTGRPWAAYALDSRMFEALVLLYRGRFDESLALTESAGEHPPPFAVACLQAVRVLALAARGAPEAPALVEALREWYDRDGFLGYCAAAAAIESAADVAGAVAAYDEHVERLSRMWQPWFAGRLRLAALTLGRMDDAATADAARRLVQDGSRALAETERNQARVGPELRMWALRLDAEDLRLRWRTGVDAPPAEDLVAAWRTTADAYGEAFAYERTRSLARLAEVLAAVGDPEAEGLREQVRADARRMGLAPVLASLGTAGPDAAAPSDLTPREKQVLALLAEGRTNRQIGQQLYITDKTVSVHVSNILAKLGAAGRTEAAAIARRDGLL